MRGHVAPVMATLPLPDGETALSGGYDRRVLRWELRTGAVVGSLEGCAGWVLSLAVAADGGLAFAGTSTGSVHAWDLASGALIGTATPHSGPVMSIDFRTAVGLLSASADGTAALLGVAPFERAA
jgi:WD40 repeat protein